MQTANDPLSPRTGLLLIILFSMGFLAGCAGIPSHSPRLPAGQSTAPSGGPAPTNTTQASAPGLGSIKVSPIDGMKMVFVPAGSFPMGSKIGLTDEQPVHTVTLDSFWLDQTEVTNAQYRLCVNAGGCRPPSSTDHFDNPAYAQHPVVFVSWNKAKDYCAWVGRRLPTEAEWEKAATWNPVTQQKYIYPWGNTFDCHKGNFDDETAQDSEIMPGSFPNCDGYPETAPVGSFPQGASPYGALDMGGNVWEWVHDAFLEVDPLTSSIKNYYAVSPAVNPQGVDPSISMYRVMRGGSWNWMFGFGRSAYRLWYGLDDAYDAVGFRCAQTP